MTAVEWKVGDRGRIGNAEFEVLFIYDKSTDVTCNGLVQSLRNDWLTAMGAVRIMPPTIGHPQSVEDNPPPRGERVLAWSKTGGMWLSTGAEAIGSQYYTHWMPLPSPPPGVTK